MFNKIQNHLLLYHPLLWNVKFVPFVAIALVLNIIFFISGYLNGAIDFTAINRGYHYDGSTPLVVLVSSTLSLILFVLWLILYFKNNAYKSYYPKKNTALYKEWLLLFAICILNCSYIVSFLYGRDIRARSYYTQQELTKQLDIISMASVFTYGHREREENTLVHGKKLTREHFTYHGRRYLFNSLINKGTFNFSLQDSVSDLQNTVKVKRWLIENKKDSVYHLMKQVFDMAAPYNLQCNITPEKWLGLVYNYPDFTEAVIVGRNDWGPILENVRLTQEQEEYENNDYESVNHKVHASSNIKKVIKGATVFFPKYYVPLDQLESAYAVMSDAYTNPYINWGSILALLYIGGALSLVIFSFRVTNGKSWLIAGLSVGISGIVIGLVTLLLTNIIFRYRFSRYWEELYFGIWIVIVVCLLLYFIITLKRQTSKGISGIFVNILLWLIPAVVPFVYEGITDNLAPGYKYIKGVQTEVMSPLETTMRYYLTAMYYANIAFVIIYMYFFTAAIKKWKGMAEA